MTAVSYSPVPVKLPENTSPIRRVLSLWIHSRQNLIYLRLSGTSAIHHASTLTQGIEAYTKWIKEQRGSCLSASGSRKE